MDEIATINKTLLIDRGLRKVKVSITKNGRMMGYIVPI